VEDEPAADYAQASGAASARAVAVAVINVFFKAFSRCCVDNRRRGAHLIAIATLILRFQSPK
jgi:hypothetical protein